MGERVSGLTLEGLAQKLEALQRENAERLETLERENERMRTENAELRDEITMLRGSHRRRHELAALRGSGTPRSGDGEAPEEFAGRVSRRSLLSKAGAAAVATVAAGTLLNPREAKAHETDPPSILTHFVWALNHEDPGTNAIRGVMEASSSPHSAVLGEHHGSGLGVKGIGGDGVQGVADTLSGIGVEGIATGSGGTGVKGTGRTGVSGESSDGGFYGVFGRNLGADGTGVRGTGDTGVWGNSSRSGFSGVYGQHTGSAGYGLVGDGKGAGGAGVLGRNSGGTGVRGEGSNLASNIAGVRGIGSTGVWGQSSKSGFSGVYGQHTGSAGYGLVGDGTGAGGAGVLGRNSRGYGGRFEGGKAQLLLIPRGTAGPPAGAHAKGEIYLDSAADLFVCVRGGSDPAWRKVTTTVA